MPQFERRISFLIFFGAFTAGAISTSKSPAQSEPQALQPTPQARIEPQNPFRHQIPIPDFPADLTWFNTAGPLQLSDLKGKFVLLDFWTYCCINCIHVLPELKKLEQAYDKQLVVVGVHSAKFDTERADGNLREAILRYEIEHPVVNDPQLNVWRMYGANSWPTILLIDPTGKAVFMRSGEFQFEQLQAVLDAAIPYYRHHGLLDETPVRFDLLANKQPRSGLSFPGKVLADEATKKLFIADSNHNRIVMTDLEGRSPIVIGSGKQGRNDGGFDEASFHHPQGLALSDQSLYVADTENHLIRRVDLAKQIVTTVAGTGVQGRNPWPGWTGDPNQKPKSGRWEGKPLTTALNSPWDLWVHGDHLLIAMAGCHQIWRMPLTAEAIGPYAGNGREDIVDGPRLPRTPFGPTACSFAQPSGLSSDGIRLYIADCEGSAIRVMALDPTKPVTTLIGPAQLPANRLFEFGDVDGNLADGKLQHALGVAYGNQKLFVADTYNDKIKVIDLTEQTIETLSGPPDADAVQFNEPAGISYADKRLYVADTNNHAIGVIDLRDGNRISRLSLPDLSPPEPILPETPDNNFAKRVPLPDLVVKPGKVTFQIQFPLAAGDEINEAAAPELIVKLSGADQLTVTSDLTPKMIDRSTIEFVAEVKGEGSANLEIDLTYFYCQKIRGRTGLCKIGRVIGQGNVAGDVKRGQQLVRLNFDGASGAGTTD